MPTFSGINSYMTYFRKNINDVFANEGVASNNNSMQEAKQKIVYNAPNTGSYDRTFEFLYANKTVVLKKGGKNKIYLSSYTPTTMAYMPSRHESWVDGSNQNKALPFWIEYGNNSSLFSYIGRDYYNLAYKLIQRNLKEAIIKGMKKRGIDIR